MGVLPRIGAAAVILLSLTSERGWAETVIAARNIRPGMVLMASDLSLTKGTTPGSYSETASLIGQEAKVTLYAGRPILSDHVGQPAIVDRNELVLLIYKSGSLTIQTDGRALGRGSPGDRIRVMNLTSKSSLFGTIQDDGSIRIQP